MVGVVLRLLLGGGAKLLHTHTHTHTCKLCIQRMTRITVTSFVNQSVRNLVEQTLASCGVTSPYCHIPMRSERAAACAFSYEATKDLSAASRRVAANMNPAWMISSPRSACKRTHTNMHQQGSTYEGKKKTGRKNTHAHIQRCLGQRQWQSCRRCPHTPH